METYSEMKEKGLLFSSLLFNGLFLWVDRATITFTLGIVVSVLAIVNYILVIRKNLKDK